MSLRLLWELMPSREETKACPKDLEQEVHQVKAVHHQATEGHRQVKADLQGKDHLEWEDLQAKARHLVWDQMVHQDKVHLLEWGKDLHQACKAVHLQDKVAHRQTEGTRWAKNEW